VKPAASTNSGSARPKTPTRSKVGRRIALTGLALLGLGAGSVTILAARHEPVIRPNVRIGLVDVSGLTREQAAKKLRIWWETERRKTISLTNAKLEQNPEPRTLTGYGISLDDKASVDQVSTEDFWESLRRQVGMDEAPAKVLDVVYRFDESKLQSLNEFVTDNNRSSQRAMARFVSGRILKQYEGGSVAVDTTALHDLLLAAAQSERTEVELPIIAGPKKVPDADLDLVRDIMASYTTRFPTAKVSRCANIKLASGKIDGVVLMPGEEWRFNAWVGRRTAKAGFREAGVFKNGKHDVDIGGGICQVSTTLYNAALYADLEITARSNHSMPVTYVPLGRDASVDYGSLDLGIRNNKSHPVAFSATYEPGKLTFRILGVQVPDQRVEIVSVGRRTWSRGEKVVTDLSLPPGRTVVVDKGGSAGSVRTFRVVYQGDVEVRRDDLGMSIYRGGQRIVARNPNSSSRGATAASTSGPAPTPEPSGIDNGEEVLPGGPG